MTTDFPGHSPYPGLRPFLRTESELFFGREECIAAMVDRLEKNRFLAVLGASGSGKSSLVKVGLVEALERGDMRGAGAHWRIVQFKPQGRPMYELASALLGGSASRQQVELMVAFLRRGPRSLLEWCESGQLKTGENLLIFVDQFEELFRYQTYAGREEAEAFAALLLRTKATRRLPVYVTLTMRSEFLGACALIEGLAEAMNDGQFLTPQMLREQCRAAIVGPARIVGFDVEEALVNRLLNDLASYAALDERLVQETKGTSAFSDASSQSDRFARRADQLPLLQHALNGLYSWTRSQSPNGPIVLKLEDYDRWGGLRGSLNRHADTILAKLEIELGSARAQEITAKLFRALVSGTSPADAQRRPVRFADLVELCNKDEAAVRAIVEAFRRTGRNFLTPDPTKEIDGNSIIDISHESLIRQWSKLSKWLETEAEDAQSWRRLADATSDEQKGAGGLLRNPNLQTLLYWRDNAKPTAEWAARYGAGQEDFTAAMTFLERSRRAHVRRNLSIGGAIVGACLLVFGLFTILSQMELNRRAELGAAELKRQKENAESDARQAALAQQLADEGTKRATFIEQQAREAKERSARQAELSNELFQATAQLFITTAQRDTVRDRWEESGSFIASLIDATPDESLTKILKPLQGRMVAQHVFRTSQGPLLGTALRTDTRGNYRLALISDKRTIAVVDARTGAQVREFDLSDEKPVDQNATHSLSPDGRRAFVIVTDTEPAREGQRARAAKSRIVFLTVDLRSRSETHAMEDNIERPESLVVDWNSRRAIWSQWRDRTQELVTLDFSKLNFERLQWSRPNLDISCKPVSDIEKAIDKEALAKAFAPYRTCEKAPPKPSDGDLSVVSLVDQTAIVQIKSSSDDVSSKLLTINISKGSVRQIISSGNRFIVSKNLVDQGSSRSSQSLAAVVTHNHLGRCNERNDSRARILEPDVNVATCLSFVDTANGTLLETSRFTLPTFKTSDDEKRYNEAFYDGIRIRATEPTGKVVIEFSERPNRWNIDASGPGALPPALVPRLSRQAERASTAVMQWKNLPPDSPGLSQEAQKQRWQYRAETSTFRLLSLDGNSAGVSTFQINPNFSITETSKRQFTRIGESTERRDGFLFLEDYPWLLSASGDKILFAHGTQLFELSGHNPDPPKPGIARRETAKQEPRGDISKAAPSDKCNRRREREEGRTSIQKLLDWPGANPAFLALDRLGRVWWISPSAENAQGVGTRQAVPAGTEPTTADMICVAQSESNSPIVTVDAKTGRLLMQMDSRTLVVMDAPEVGGAAKPSAPEQLGEGPLEDDIEAATFVNSDQLAVLHKNGLLAVFSRVQHRWTKKTIPDAGLVFDFKRSRPTLLASKQWLLVVHENRAIIFKLDDGPELPVVAAGVLPGAPERTVLLNFNATEGSAPGEPVDLSIDLLSDAQLLRVRLPQVPPPNELARILTARYPPVEGPQKIMIQAQTRLVLDESRAASKLKRLAALDESSRCRILLRALFAPERLAGDIEETQRVTLREDTRRACNSSRPDATDAAPHWMTDATSLALEKTDPTPWPRAASSILRAAASGDTQALWTITGWLSKQIKAGLNFEPRQANAWQDLLGRMVDQARPELDPDLTAATVTDQDSRGAPARSISSLNPRYHERIGDRLRNSDSATARRDAMFHYSLAETLDAASRDDVSAIVTAKKRASVARILAPQDLLEAQKSLASWTSARSSGPAALSLAPEDEPTRLREDLKILDNLMQSSKHEEMKLVLAEIARRVAATSGRGDRSSEKEGRRKFAFLASGYSRPLADRTAEQSLGRLSEEFSDDPVFFVTVLARLLSAIENEKGINGLSRIPDLNIYQRIAEAINSKIKSSDASLAALANNLTLSRRVFAYRTVRGSDRAQFIAAASALKARNELLTELLKHSPQNPDYLAHQGFGRFWMGLSTAYVPAANRREIVDFVLGLVGTRSENLQAAIASLKRAREEGDKDFDTQHRLADAQRWLIGTDEEHRARFADVAEEAVLNYQTLTDAAREKQWTPSSSLAWLQSEHAEVLRKLSRRASELDGQLEDKWRAGDGEAKVRSAHLVLDSLSSAMLADRLAKEIERGDGQGWDIKPGNNRDFAFAVATLANRLMFTNKQLLPADDCDRAASNPYDPLRRAPGVFFQSLRDAGEFEAIKKACTDAQQKKPQDPHAAYLLARTLFISKDRKDKERALELWSEAADRKYAIAFNNLALRFRSGSPQNEQYYVAYIRMVLKNHFTPVYRYLSSHERGKRDREALLWLAERAAEVGVVEAHEALAEAASDQEKRKMHLLIAGRLAEGAVKAGFEVRGKRIILPPEAENRVREMVGEFRAATIYKLSSSDKEELKRTLSDDEPL